MKKYFVLFFIVLFATITIWADFSFAQRRSTRRAATTGRSTKKTSASENSNETTKKNSGRSTKRAATGGRSTKRAATGGRSTKRAATSSTGRSTKRAATGGRSTKRAATSSTGRSTKRAATSSTGRKTQRAATSSTGRKTQRAATSSTGRSVRRSSTNRARPFGRGKNSGSTRVVSKTPVVVEEVKVELVDCPVYSMIKKVQPKDENGNPAVDEGGNDIFKYYKYASTGDIECKLNDEYMNEDEKPWEYETTSVAKNADIQSNTQYFKEYKADVKNDDASLKFIYIACKDEFIKRGDIKKGFNCLDISSICPLQVLKRVEKAENGYLNTDTYDECTLPAHSTHNSETNSLYCKQGYYASGDDTVKYECLACPSESKTDWLEKNPGGNYPTECPETGSASQQETTENAEGDASSENDGEDCKGEGKIPANIDGTGCKCDDTGAYTNGVKYVKVSDEGESLKCMKLDEIKLSQDDCWVNTDPSASEKEKQATYTTDEKDEKGNLKDPYCKCPDGWFGDGLKESGYLLSEINNLTKEDKEKAQPAYCNLVKYIPGAMKEDGSYSDEYKDCNNYYYVAGRDEKGTKVPRGCIQNCPDGQAWLEIPDTASKTTVPPAETPATEGGGK